MVWDIIIIGAGPGGLQAAIAGASEGLKVLVVEKAKVGGQIGQTPKLENSVFAAGGITGPKFAEMMYQQAKAMGVEFLSGTVINIKRMNAGELEVRVTPAWGQGLHIQDAHTVIIAVGSRWREIEVPGIQSGLKRGDIQLGPVGSIQFKGRGGHAAVYGGGPAAGQAILALADNESLAGVVAFMRSNLNMPEYLAERIRQHPRVILRQQTTLVACRKQGESLLVNTSEGEAEVEALFLCNGLVPNTEWLDNVVDKTRADQIRTGDANRSSLETSMKGVFAIGDCRHGSTARVGSAIGEGSMAITEIWTYFSNNPVCAICPKLLGKKVAV